MLQAFVTESIKPVLDVVITYGAGHFYISQSDKGGLVFGASLQAFAIVLMSFILGIGLGGAAVASPRTRSWAREAATIGLLLGAAAWIGLLVAGVEHWVDFYRWVKTGLARTETGYTFH